MKTKRQMLLISVACIGLFLLTAARVAALTSPLPPDKWQLNVTVPVEATVQTNPPAITLRVHKVERSYQVYRKGPYDLSWTGPIGTIPGGTGVWTDTNVVVGVEYEYRLYGGTTTGRSRSDTRLYGYIRSGIAVDQTGWRGRVALVVENRVFSNLMTELTRYIEDLTGDGWTVHVIPTPRGEGYGGMAGTGFLHVPIRNQIISLYTNYPGEVKHVSLLGNVPEPRTGLSYSGPDGHGNKAAFGTDAYYGDVNGTWTDTGVNTATGAMTNAPGDGKYDETRTPTSNWNYFELGFGRMDMPFLAEGPLLGLRNYLDKLYRYKQAAPDFRPGRRGLIRNGFDNVSETGWNSMTALLGLDNIEYLPAGIQTSSGNMDYDQRYSAENGPFLFYAKGDSAPGRGIGGRAVIWTGCQSLWGYWYETTYMANALAEDSFTLSYTWSIWGLRYFYHRLGLGDVMGDMMRVSINNRGWYSTDGLHRIDSYYWPNGDHTGVFFMNHLGDPLLRLYMFPPARNLRARPIGGGVQLNWEASEDPAVAGYHVYRSTAMDQPFTRLTTTPIAATTYTDSSVTSGTHIYMVRAVKLDTTASGTFWNGSQGVFRTINLDAASPALGVATTNLPTAFFDSAYTASLTATGGYPAYAWSVQSGALPSGLQLSSDGQLSGTPTESGNFPVTIAATDAAGTTATRAFTLTVQPHRQRVFVPEADAHVLQVNPTYNYGAAREIAPGVGYWLGHAYLRFACDLPAGLTNVARATLRFYSNENTSMLDSESLEVALVDDDSWIEGTGVGTASTSSINWSNRPPDRAGVPAVSRAGKPVWGAPHDIDVTSLVNADRAVDSTGKVTLRVGLNGGWTRLMFPSRESLMQAYRPQLILEYASGPQVTLVTPASGQCRVAPGREAWLAARVTHPTVDPATLTLSWSVVRQPAGATVQFSMPNAAATAVAFDREGSYVLRLTASDGAQTAVVDATVEVSAISLPAGPAPEIAHYTFDESSGAVAHNRAGGPDGTLVNFNLAQAWVNDGKFGGALNFAADNGSTRSHVVALPHAAYDFALDRPWTVSLWVKLTQGNVDVAGKAVATLTQKQLRLRPEGSDSRTSFTVGGSAQTMSFNERVINDGQWRMMTVVNDPSQKMAFGFVDGGLGGIRMITPTNEITTADFLIGTVRNANNTDTTDDYDGLIDDVRVYDRALSWSEVRRLYQAELLNLAPVVVLAPVTNAVNPGVPVTLAATVSDDGLPVGSSLTYRWEKAAGPGSVVFGTSNAPVSTATFSVAGNYVVRLVASDSEAAAAATLAVSVVAPGEPNVNLMPVVNAGPDRGFITPQTITLAGSATDDGRPNPPAQLTYQWRQLSGPGVVTFADPTQPGTTARLPGYGVYVLELIASDGALAGSDTVTLTVSDTNQAPIVNAGGQRTVYAMTNITVTGSVSDDGLPDPPGAVSVTWRQISGPATATINNSNSLTATVWFPALGDYVLELRASDGALSSQDLANFTVIRQTEGNTPPVIGLTGPLQWDAPGTYFINPQISDDGLPRPPGAVTSWWTKVSGPAHFAGYAHYMGSNSLVAFGAPGDYVARIVADDGLLQSTNEIAMSVADLRRYSNVYAWGGNSWYQCGPFVYQPDKRNITPPARVARDWRQVAIGNYAAYGLGQDGLVYASGTNAYFSLGVTNTTVARRHFAPIAGLSNIVQIATHGYGGVALRTDGSVWTWGYGYYGQHGNGATTDIAVPNRVPGISNIVQIAAYDHSVYAVHTNGTVWGWGSNAYGQLGKGTTNSAQTTPVQMLNITNAVRVAAGTSFSLVLLRDGTLRASGWNQYGQLADGTYTNRWSPVTVLKSSSPSTPLTDVAEISGGGSYALAADAHGYAWGWGYNQSGRAGVGSSVIQTNLADLVRDNNDPTGYLTNVKKIAASVFTSYALKNDGTVYGWGAGSSYNWGSLEDTATRYTAGRIVNLPATVDLWAGQFSAMAITGPPQYDTFQIEHFTAAEIAAGLADPEYDFDGDGQSNLLEWVLQTNPRQANTGAWASRREGNEFVFEVEYLNVAEDVTVEFQTSTDLRSWEAAQPASVQHTDRGDLRRTTLRFNIGPGQDRLFVRMKARLVE